MQRSKITGQTCVAAAVIGLGVLVAVETASITVSPGYARIGPRVFPLVVAAAMCALGSALMFQALTGHWQASPPADHRWQPLAVIGAGLAGYAILMQPAGFVIASTVLFAAVARAFESRRLLRDIGIGLGLARAAYLFFYNVLQVALRAGQIFNAIVNAKTGGT